MMLADCVPSSITPRKTRSSRTSSTANRRQVRSARLSKPPARYDVTHSVCDVDRFNVLGRCLCCSCDIRSVWTCTTDSRQQPSRRMQPHTRSVTRLTSIVELVLVHCCCSRACLSPHRSMLLCPVLCCASLAAGSASNGRYETRLDAGVVS